MQDNAELCQTIKAGTLRTAFQGVGIAEGQEISYTRRPEVQFLSLRTETQFVS